MKYESNLHWFYSDVLKADDTFIKLGAEETFHALKVLRHKIDDDIFVTNGKGLVAKCKITGTNNKQAELKIIKIDIEPVLKYNIHLVFSPVKSKEKNEWVIEKAVEIGVNEISFFTSARSERTKLNFERLDKIMITAIKQSLNPFKPVMHQLEKFESFIKKNNYDSYTKIIACCDVPGDRFFTKYLNKTGNIMVVIGPEGDFTTDEIEIAKQNRFIPVSLGNNRLRSETAAVYAISAIKTFMETNL